TDKAIMELVARGDGVLRARMLAEGDSSPVGQVIGVIAAEDEDISELVAAAGGGGAGAAATDAGPPPKDEGTAESPDSAAPSPSDVVASTREQAGASSVPRSTQEAQGEASAPPQEKTAGAADHAPHTPMPTAREHASEQPPHAQDNGGRLRSSPLARRLASEQGLQLDQIRGTGPGGRIVRRDIESALEAGTAREAEGAAPAAAAAPAREGDYTDIPLTQIRKTIARRLAESIGPIPTFYLTADFDL